MTFGFWVAASLFMVACIAVVARQAWLEMHPRTEYEEAVARLRVRVLESQRIIGEKFVPACQCATEAFRKFAEAWASAQKETE